MLAKISALFEHCIALDWWQAACNYAQRLTACVHLNSGDCCPICGWAPVARILLKVCHMYRRSVLRVATQLVALRRSFSSLQEHVVSVEVRCAAMAGECRALIP